MASRHDHADYGCGLQVRLAPATAVGGAAELPLRQQRSDAFVTNQDDMSVQSVGSGSGCALGALTQGLYLFSGGFYSRDGTCRAMACYRRVPIARVSQPAAPTQARTLEVASNGGRTVIIEACGRSTP